jgi:hypothetical protein
VSQDGESSILKVFSDQVKEEVPQSFLKKIEGMRLQALHGGPQIFDIGSISQEANHPHFFVRMECLFCGSQTSNLKDIESSSENLVTHLEANDLGISGRIGELLANAVGDHILPVDPDFYFSEKGEARWIDGERWYQVPSIRSRSYEFADTFWTVLEYLKRAYVLRPDLWPQASTQFYEQFFSRVEGSLKLRPNEKSLLVAQIFNGRAARDLRTFSNARILSSPEVLRLFQEASTFYRQRSRTARGLITP